MHLVLLSPPVELPQEQAVLRSLFAAGLQTYHLRKPSSSLGQLRQYLEELPPQYRNRVVVHQHHSLARECGLKGLHFRERDRQARLVERVPGLTMSTSIHSLQQLGDCGEGCMGFAAPITCASSNWILPGACRRV
jgi:thiamine-phosphate pyrophosphorylase